MKFPIKTWVIESAGGAGTVLDPADLVKMDLTVTQFRFNTTHLISLVNENVTLRSIE